MRARLAIPVARVLTLGCVILLAVLSLWPGRGIGFLYVLPEFNSMRTGLPGGLEHFAAYAGSAAVGMAGYGASWGGLRIIGSFLGVCRDPRVPPTSRLAGIRRSLISRPRRLERCAVRSQ
jgi:hypothetical protein